MSQRNLPCVGRNSDAQGRELPRKRVLKAASDKHQVGRAKPIVLVGAERVVAVDIGTAQGLLEIKRHNMAGRYERLAEQKTETETAFQVTSYTGTLELILSVPNRAGVVSRAAIGPMRVFVERRLGLLAYRERV